MFVIKSIELALGENRAEIVIFDHHHGLGRRQHPERTNDATEVLDMCEDIGEGDDVGPAMTPDEFGGDRLTEKILDDVVPALRCLLRGSSGLDPKRQGALLAKEAEKAAIVATDVEHDL